MFDSRRSNRTGIPPHRVRLLRLGRCELFRSRIVGDGSVVGVFGLATRTRIILQLYFSGINLFVGSLIYGQFHEFYIINLISLICRISDLLTVP